MAGCQHILTGLIGQGFDRSLWPRGRAFELSYFPKGRNI